MRSASVSLDKATLHGDEVIKTPIGDICLNDTYFDNDASSRLFDEMDYQRASQSLLGSEVAREILLPVGDATVGVTTWT